MLDGLCNFKNYLIGRENVEGKRWGGGASPSVVDCARRRFR